MQSNIFHEQLFVYVLNLSFLLLSVCKKIRTYKKGKSAQHYKGSVCYVKVMDCYFLYSHVVPPLPAGPAFGGEGRIRSLLTQARATRMNLTSLLLVNLELA